jgi:WD40 repeat protein
MEMGGVPAVSFSPDGRTLAMCAYDKDVKLLDATSGQVRRVLSHPAEANLVTFSADGRLLATCCWDHRIRIWDLENGKVRAICKGHSDWISSAVFSPDGKQILSSAPYDGTKVWDAQTGQEKRIFPMLDGTFILHHYGPCARFSPDGHWIIVGGSYQTMSIWNADTGEMRARLGGQGSVRQMAFSDAAEMLAACYTLESCGTGSHVVYLYDLTFHEPDASERERLRTLLAKLDDDSYEAREAISRELVASGFRAESELRKAMKESPSTEVRIRARVARQQILSKPRAELWGHTGEVYCVAFSPDRKLLASGSKDGTVRIWDVKTRQDVAKLSIEAGGSGR